MYERWLKFKGIAVQSAFNSPMRGARKFGKFIFDCVVTESNKIETIREFLGCGKIKLTDLWQKIFQSSLRPSIETFLCMTSVQDTFQ